MKFLRFLLPQYFFLTFAALVILGLILLAIAIGFDVYWLWSGLK